MGLDMYFKKINKEVSRYINIDLEECKQNNAKLYEQLKPHIIMQGSEPYHYEPLSEKVGYWRKANQIHNWFVENVQNWVDNCKLYEVSQDKLSVLLNLCKQVNENICLAPVESAWQFAPGDSVRIKYISQGRNIISGAEICNNLLPTCEGFFFGSTEYDEYYLDDIATTIDILEAVLENTNFETHSIFYRSSW